MKKYKSLLEDRRNILPKDFDSWVNKEFGDIEGMANNYDIQIDEVYDYLQKNIDRDYINEEDYDIEEEYEEALEKIQWDKFYSDSNLLYDDWVWKYKSMIFPMIVYRVIDMKAKNLEDLSNIEVEKCFKRGIGEYWTDGEGELEAYCSRGGNSFTVRAEIKEKDVNWRYMLLANMSPILGEEESEINLDIGTKILLTGIAEGKTTEKDDFMPLDVIVRV